MEKKRSTYFETLPNELLYEIFCYLGGLELYQTLWDLNSRINEILRSLINISFQAISPSDIDHILVSQFASRVTYLSFVWSDCIDVTRFQNVRSLAILDFLTAPQLKQLRHDQFSHLVYLRLSYMEDSLGTSEFFQKVFSNRFPLLSKCVFEEIFPPDRSQPWSSSPSLRSLTVGRLTQAVYRLVLLACSNLIHLHWSAVSYTDDDIKATPVRHAQLKSLYIRTINIQMIEEILRCVPCLKRLHVVSDWSRGNNCLPLDFEKLSCILLRCLPMLTHFDCDTMERNPLNIDIIRELHLCFQRIQSKYTPDGRIQFYTVKRVF